MVLFASPHHPPPNSFYWYLSQGKDTHLSNAAYESARSYLFQGAGAMSLTVSCHVKLASSVSFREVTYHYKLKIMVTAVSGRTSVMWMLEEHKSNKFF